MKGILWPPRKKPKRKQRKK